jgi:hypothetical protein
MRFLTVVVIRFRLDRETIIEESPITAVAGRSYESYVFQIRVDAVTLSNYYILIEFLEDYQYYEF